jgi:hypothetical protein
MRRRTRSHYQESLESMRRVIGCGLESVRACCAPGTLTSGMHVHRALHLNATWCQRWHTWLTATQYGVRMGPFRVNRMEGSRSRSRGRIRDHKITAYSTRRAIGCGTVGEVSRDDDGFPRPRITTWVYFDGMINWRGRCSFVGAYIR